MHGNIGSYPITMADQNRRRYPHRSRTSRSRDIYPQTDIRQLPLLPPSIWIIGCGRRRWTYLDHLYKPEENMSVCCFYRCYYLLTWYTSLLEVRIAYACIKLYQTVFEKKNKVLRFRKKVRRRSAIVSSRTTRLIIPSSLPILLGRPLASVHVLLVVVRMSPAKTTT